MARVHGFEEASVARLRERLGATEQERDHLLAFARGHSGAVASIHRAVLAALEAGNDALIDVVTNDWPAILGIDASALLLVDCDSALLATATGRQSIDPALVKPALDSASPLTMRSVDRGHVLFSPGCAAIRAEALVPFDCHPGAGRGLLLLGQNSALPVDPRRGGDLLLFLARSLGAMMGQWTTARSN